MAEETEKTYAVQIPSQLVLCIEDDDVDFEAVEHACSKFKNLSSTLVRAKSLEEAVSKLKDARFDLILCDLSLPDSHGTEIVGAILRVAPSTPQVIISGSDDRKIASKALGLGVQDYLSKGRFSPRELERAIIYAINRNSLLNNLRRSNSEFQDFARELAHDLREPLRMVHSYLDLLMRRTADKLSDNEKEYLDFARDGALRMEAMIHGLFDYASLDKPRQLEMVDLHVILNEVEENLDLLIRENEAQITLDPLPKVFGHPTQLELLLQNLIQNSIKYRSEKSPCIHIGHITGEPDAVFFVEDNEVGIAEDFRTEVFEIFRRLHTHSEVPGSGMGLAACKKIVTLHGGEIWVEANYTGGTRVYFTLCS